MKYLYFPDTLRYAGTAPDDTPIPYCFDVPPPSTPAGMIVEADPAAGTWVTRAETSAELAAAQSAQIVAISAACAVALATITAAYPDLEVSTWPQQLADANAYTANNSATTPMLSAISAASGQSVSALASGVLAKSATYQAASGAAIGKRLALTAQIQAATTVDAVKAIVWS